MGEMVVSIRSTATVKPSQESSKRSLWVSNVDLVVSRFHLQSIYFYKCNGSSGFFEPNLVKEALSRTLIPYFPAAGRLTTNTESGRIEINCNDEGVVFLEAETTSVLDDFGDFAPTIEYLKLVPSIDYSSEVSSRPLLLVQLTYFKCGGISVGVAIHHLLADGSSIVSFMNSWASMARGIDLAAWPSIERTPLRAQDPPSPKFEHVEYEPSLSLLTPRPANVTLRTSAFNISRDLIKALKANAKEDGNTTSNISYTSFEILAGHIWRCVCKARGLSDMQPSKLYVPVDGRSRLEPKLPPVYFGNAIFTTTTVASAGELVSNPASYAAGKIHETLSRMDDEYLRSALDYIEVHPDKGSLIRGAHTFRSPNLTISSIAQLPIYDADFGWGRPTSIRRGWIQCEGSCFVGGNIDGGLYLVITLEDEHMQLFETYFNAI